MSRRIRRTPYTDSVEEVGGRGFSVVNHMLLPKAFSASVEEAYWHLHAGVQIWDVACQRQVEVYGVDAARLVQWMTPRNLAGMKVGACRYVPLVNQHGGMINDPILLKLADDRFWLSIADSDVLLWASGLAVAANMQVSVCEPDVSPLAIQGPRAQELMVAVFGEGIRRLRFFEFAYFDFCGTSQLIARSGYSSVDGFEIYLAGSELGGDLWSVLWEAGQGFGIRPGCPNLIDRIEHGLLSYGNEITADTNPLECGLGAFCDLGETASIGGEALRAIAAAGIGRQIHGVVFDGEACPACVKPWAVVAVADTDTDTTGTGESAAIGEVTSAIYSPRMHANVGLAMIHRDYWNAGTKIQIHCPDGIRQGKVARLPLVKRRG